MNPEIGGEADHGSRFEKVQCPVCQCWTWKTQTSETCFECEPVDLDGEPLRRSPEGTEPQE